MLVHYIYFPSILILKVSISPVVNAFLVLPNEAFRSLAISDITILDTRPKVLSSNLIQTFGCSLETTHDAVFMMAFCFPPLQITRPYTAK